MKIYTKTGDDGETGLYGGQRVVKHSIRIDTYGTLDELNSFIGLAITEITDKDSINFLTDLQSELFNAGADLASPFSSKTEKLKIKRISLDFTNKLEQEIDKISLSLEPMKYFILPGGAKSACYIHVARTVCRRAERLCTALNSTEQINKNIIIFLNRLSDYLFVLARYLNHLENYPETHWKG